jgi:hypothetical protein
LVAASIAGIMFFGQNHLWKSLPSFANEIIAFLTLTTLGLYFALVRSTGSPRFTPIYLFSMVSKMIFYGAFIFLVIYSDRSGARSNVTLFLVGYIIFTALEVGFLFRVVNRPGDKKN